MGVLAAHLDTLPHKSDWQEGYDTWMQGGVVPLPGPGEDYEARQRSAGWCAARRAYLQGAPAPADAAAQPVTFGDLDAGERFFDPDCGEDFEKVDHCTARFMTGGDVFEGEIVDFTSGEPVERVATEKDQQGSTAAAPQQRGERA